MSVMPPRGSTVAIYARYSTDMQSPTSIDGQIRLCEQYAAERGWIVTGRYTDAERSGTTTAGRTGLFQMLLAAERGECQVVLTEDLDRTSRNAADMHLIARDLEELDIALCTVASGVVSDIELAFKAVQNQQFIKQNTAKSKRGQENAVASGRMSGSVPFGYRKVIQADARGDAINGVREIDPERAAIVRRVHESFAAGMTTYQICAELNGEGVPSPKGRQWRPGSLLGNKHGGLGILRNPIYIGEFQFRKTRRKLRKGTVKMQFTRKDERLIVQHPELAIVERELWDRVQDRLAEWQGRPFHAKPKITYLFTGKVKCSECGSSYTVTEGRFACNGRVAKGICTNSRRAKREALEETVLARLRDHVLTDEVLGPCLDAYREETERAAAEQTAKVAGGEVRLKEINQRIANLTTQLGAAPEASFSSQVIMQELDRLGDEKQRLDHEAKLRPRTAPQALDPSSIVARIRASLHNLQELLESEDREAVRARELVRGLIDRIVLTPKGEPADGRGGGDLMVTVEGKLASLINLADLDINSVTKHKHGPMLVLDNGTLGFRFSYPLEWRDPRLAQVYSDLPTIAKLLDEASTPLLPETLAKALDGPDAGSGPASHRAQLSTFNVTRYLLEHGLVRKIKMAHKLTGIVWNYVGLSDEAWRDRWYNPPMTANLPPVRIVAPGAVVVVIGSDSVPEARL